MVWGGASDAAAPIVQIGGNIGNVFPDANGRIVVDSKYVDVLVQSGWLPVAGDPVFVSTQTGTSYTFALADAESQVLFSNGSAVTATVPPNSSVAFPIGTTLDIEQAGAGQVTIAAGAGVTVRHAAATLKTNTQYSVARVRKTATDTWVASGDLAAS